MEIGLMKNFRPEVEARIDAYRAAEVCSDDVSFIPYPLSYCVFETNPFSYRLHGTPRWVSMDPLGLVESWRVRSIRHWLSLITWGWGCLLRI